MSKKLFFRRTKEEDIKEIKEIIDRQELAKEVFIKSSEDEIKKIIDGSYVAVDDKDNIVGVCLIKNRYIDTIAVKKKGQGIGSFLLENLHGYYTTHISKKKSKKFGVI